MKRKFVLNLFLLLLLNILVKPFWVFGIDRNVQIAVGQAEYGVYFALFNLSLVLNILLDIGITNFNNRNIAQHNFLAAKHLEKMVILKVILAVFYTIVTFSVGLIVGYRGYQLFLLGILALNQFLNSFILYLRSNVSALQMFKTDGFLSITDRFLMIIICSYLLWGGFSSNGFKIEWFILAQSVAYLLTILITFTILIRKIKITSVKIDYLFSILILKKSLPYALLILLMGIYNRLDSIFIERLLENGDKHAGIYAQGYRVLDALNMFAYLFAGLLLPMFAYMIKNRQDVRQIIRLAANFLLVPALIIALGCFTFKSDIIGALYHHSDEYSALTFGILILGFVPISVTYIFGTLLTANGSLKELNLMAIFAVIINIVLNLVLIPRYQAVGAAISSLTTQTFAAVVQFLIAKRIFSINIKKSVYLSVLLFIASIIIFSYLSSFFTLPWFAELLLLSVLSLIMAQILKIFDVKAIYQLIRLRED
ncbi:MAG TPA: polysaccharide biosynthesis C-terminal domain-containing protein [Salinivirgaceae bacterium]|nr:polysaccharide biosynthesis C-terminal domain-containing protein [Salinivirgaceae bacterium]